MSTRDSSIESKTWAQNYPTVWDREYIVNVNEIYLCFTWQYAEGVILNLENMWEESDIRTPMICFLSMGSDPTASIEALAKKQRLGTECWFVMTILVF